MLTEKSYMIEHIFQLYTICSYHDLLSRNIDHSVDALPDCKCLYNSRDNQKQSEHSLITQHLIPRAIHQNANTKSIQGESMKTTFHLKEHNLLSFLLLHSDFIWLSSHRTLQIKTNH